MLRGRPASAARPIYFAKILSTSARAVTRGLIAGRRCSAGRGGVRASMMLDTVLAIMSPRTRAALISITAAATDPHAREVLTRDLKQAQLDLWSSTKWNARWRLSTWRVFSGVRTMQPILLLHRIRRTDGMRNFIAYWHCVRAADGAASMRERSTRAGRGVTHRPRAGRSRPMMRRMIGSGSAVSAS